jgi:hypothetical protein
MSMSQGRIQYYNMISESYAREDKEIIVKLKGLKVTRENNDVNNKIEFCANKSFNKHF